MEPQVRDDTGGTDERQHPEWGYICEAFIFFLVQMFAVWLRIWLVFCCDSEFRWYFAVSQNLSGILLSQNLRWYFVVCQNLVHILLRLRIWLVFCCVSESGWYFVVCQNLVGILLCLRIWLVFCGVSEFGWFLSWLRSWLVFCCVSEFGWYFVVSQNLAGLLLCLRLWFQFFSSFRLPEVNQFQILGKVLRLLSGLFSLFRESFCSVGKQTKSLHFQAENPPKSSTHKQTARQQQSLATKTNKTASATTNVNAASYLARKAIWGRSTIQRSSPRINVRSNNTSHCHKNNLNFQIEDGIFVQSCDNVHHRCSVFFDSFSADISSCPRLVVQKIHNKIKTNIGNLNKTKRKPEIWKTNWKARKNWERTESQKYGKETEIQESEQRTESQKTEQRTEKSEIWTKNWKPEIWTKNWNPEIWERTESQQTEERTESQNKELKSQKSEQRTESQKSEQRTEIQKSEQRTESQNSERKNWKPEIWTENWKVRNLNERTKARIQNKELKSQKSEQKELKRQQTYRIIPDCNFNIWFALQQFCFVIKLSTENTSKISAEDSIFKFFLCRFLAFSSVCSDFWLFSSSTQ